jgi:hypothetical protein
LDNGNELPGCFSTSYAADTFDIELYSEDNSYAGTYNLLVTSTITLVSNPQSTKSGTATVEVTISESENTLTSIINSAPYFETVLPAEIFHTIGDPVLVLPLPAMIDDEGDLPIEVSVKLGQASYFIKFEGNALIFQLIEDLSWVGTYTINVVMTDSVESKRSYSIAVHLESNLVEEDEDQEDETEEDGGDGDESSESGANPAVDLSKYYISVEQKEFTPEEVAELVVPTASIVSISFTGLMTIEFNMDMNYISLKAL